MKAKLTIEVKVDVAKVIAELTKLAIILSGLFLPL